MVSLIVPRGKSHGNNLKSFQPDVAHELRTPRTNMIGQTPIGLSH